MVDCQFTEGSEVVDFNEQVWRVLRERGHFFSLNTVGYYVVGFLAAIPFLVWMRLWSKRPPQN